MTWITLLWALLHDNWGFSFSCDYSSGAALLGNASETIIWLKQLPWILVSQSWSLCRTHSVCARGLCLSIKADLWDKLCWEQPVWPQVPTRHRLGHAVMPGKTAPGNHGTSGSCGWWNSRSALDLLPAQQICPVCTGGKEQHTVF